MKLSRADVHKKRLLTDESDDFFQTFYTVDQNVLRYTLNKEVEV